MELRRRKRLSLNKFPDKRHVTVVDVGICDNVYQFAHVHVTDLSDHVHKNCVLNNVPVVCCKNVLGSLVEDRI